MASNFVIFELNQAHRLPWEIGQEYIPFCAAYSFRIVTSVTILKTICGTYWPGNIEILIHLAGNSNVALLVRPIVHIIWLSICISSVVYIRATEWVTK